MTYERLSLEKVYESYAWYCRTVGHIPPSFDQWRKELDKVGEWHDNPSAIIAYNTQ